jgi:hypothetical protein
MSYARPSHTTDQNSNPASELLVIAARCEIFMLRRSPVLKEKCRCVVARHFCPADVRIAEKLSGKIFLKFSSFWLLHGDCSGNVEQQMRQL